MVIRNGALSRTGSVFTQLWRTPNKIAWCPVARRCLKSAGRMCVLSWRADGITTLRIKIIVYDFEHRTSIYIHLIKTNPLHFRIILGEEKLGVLRKSVCKKCLDGFFLGSIGVCEKILQVIQANRAISKGLEDSTHQTSSRIPARSLGPRRAISNSYLVGWLEHDVLPR